MVRDRRTRITLFLCALFAFAVPIGVYLLVTQVVVAQNERAMREMVIENAEQEMRMMVENVISSIEAVRSEVLVEMDEKAQELEILIRTSAAEPRAIAESGIQSYIIPESIPLQILVEDLSGTDFAVLYHNTQITEFPDVEHSMKQRIESSPIYCEIERNGYLYYIFSEQSDLDAVVKQQIRQEIHHTMYGAEKYVWINELINPAGGDNYAVRAIHPNLVDTEGEYLSTNMTDVAGNLPYLSELNGILQDGEITHSYYFKKMTSDEIAEKLSYAKFYEPYQWIVATGQPLEDILAITNDVTRKNEALSNTLLVICVLTDTVILAVTIISQMKFRRKMDAYIREETALDHLTGALSRKAGDREIEKCFQRYQREGINFMMVMMDVDNFKGINDNYGHDAGDFVLCRVVKAIQDEMSDADRVIRWGGDEFILIHQGENPEACEKEVDKLLTCIRNIGIVFKNETIPVTASMGYSFFLPNDTDRLSIFSRMDNALYRAKNQGRNQYLKY